jgi:hypothetical protein
MACGAAAVTTVGGWPYCRRCSDDLNAIRRRLADLFGWQGKKKKGRRRPKTIGIRVCPDPRLP